MTERGDRKRATIHETEWDLLDILWTKERATAREVTAQINHAREMLALAESQVATLTALRNEMRLAKAHTIGELPADVRARHRGAISACAGVPGGVELW